MPTDPRRRPFWAFLSQAQSGRSHLQRAVTHTSPTLLLNRHSSPMRWAFQASFDKKEAWG